MPDSETRHRITNGDDDMNLNPHFTWDGRISSATLLAVIQIIGILGGGFYFVGEFNEKFASVLQRMDMMQLEIGRVTDRIDRVTDGGRLGASH